MPARVSWIGARSTVADTVRRRPGPALIVAIMVALAILLSLGTWQLYRLQWKEALVTEIAVRQKAAPASLADVERMLADGTDIDYLPATVSGTFDHAKEQYFFATDDGKVGYHVYTPLALDDGRTVFVNRGFVPEDLKAPSSRTAGQVEGTVTIIGLARAKLAAKPSWVVPENEPHK
ncbi:MAG: SURF1 family protein, partial [Alphaproteobacteria bacterium]